MKKMLVLGVAGVLVTSLAFAASPQDSVTREVATAEIHANVAQKMDSISGSQLHLHHVINCLVGVNGAGYSAAAERVSANPCKGLGHGALSDSAGDGAVHSQLERVLADAKSGLEAKDLATVHTDATKAYTALQAAQRQAKHKTAAL